MIIISQNKELETQYLLQKDLINSNDHISIQIVKEKIEEIKENIPYLSQFSDWNKEEYTNKDVINNCIEVLQELLEESEDSENGEGKKSTNTSRNTRA